MKIDIQDELNRPDPVNWLFCGDSITQGAAHTRGGRDYPQHFRERLGELARNEDIVINTAVGGWSTGTLEPRLEDRVLRHQPDVVFLLFGTNDAVGGAEGLDAFTERYKGIVNRIREAGIRKVILQTTVPMIRVDPEAQTAAMNWPDPQMRAAKLHGLKQRLQHIESYVEATRNAAAAAGVPLVDHWAVWEECGGQRGQITDGGFHPNEYGHILMAHTLIRACGMWDEKSWVCRLFVPVNHP
jgi:acyl-CoA thioesterase-1